MAMLVDKERVQDGCAAYRQWLPTLRQIEQRYGVSPAVVTGVWGVESNFGKIAAAAHRCSLCHRHAWAAAELL